MINYVSQILHLRLPQRARLAGVVDFLRMFPSNSVTFLNRVKSIGIPDTLSVPEKSKLQIFNQLNFFQFITGIIVPVVGLLSANKFPASGWLIVCMPALVSVLVLTLNSYHHHQLAVLAYFVFYPLFICVNYINGINLGVELSFILYGILSVFFIRDIGYMIFSISFSMVSYFFLSVVLKKYTYQLADINFAAYLINQGLAIVYIFYGLYLIKTENANYNTTLQESNYEIQKQSNQLQIQAEELDQLNSLKNKLFSVISHDLKAPMYALRNLFDNIHKQDMPAQEIKELIPEVKKDLNYTVSLMENLLQWAKSQMQSHTVKSQLINITDVIDEVMHLLHLQAEAKRITIVKKTKGRVYAWADYDMINLVIRNLVSNSIKFTPNGGKIIIGASEMDAFAEVYVQDTGKGMSSQDVKKINSYEFFTTNGTAQEQGTGLGLMLCKEFLAKNDGHLRIESTPGKGSTFSFTLPLGD
ncbi:MAG: HAMP domain-containing histidine kinase [Chitinophagaceae bacterium]|nr:HAMP domain-containing histidine kinase [Chitinophagaceae bacterium]